MDHPWQDLLFYLYKEGRIWYRDLRSDDWRRALLRSHNTVEYLNLQVLTESWAAQNHIRGTSTSSDPGVKKGFIIPPCKHSEDSLTVLVPFIPTNGANPRLSLQLGVITSTFFFGYRFESPELHEEHRFHHVQPVQGFGHGQRVATSASPYPYRYPSFPILASGGAELLAAVLVSIRDWARLIELTTSSHVPHNAKQVMAAFLEKVRPST